MSRQGSPGIARRVYDAFASNRVDAFDAIVSADVEINSPLGRGMRGVEALKTWAGAFHEAFEPAIDLVDEFEAGDRAVVTVNLRWRHVGEFFGCRPTGRRGTSIEVFLLTLDGGKVVRWDVADHTLDLVTYLIRDHGYPYPQYVEPTPIVAGAAAESFIGGAHA